MLMCLKRFICSCGADLRRKSSGLQVLVQIHGFSKLLCARVLWLVHVVVLCFGISVGALFVFVFSFSYYLVVLGC